MSQQIASDLTGNSAALTLLDAPNAAPPPPPFKLKPLPPLDERELSLRVQQILAPPSHGRRKIWEFDDNLHCSIIGTCLTNTELRHALVKLGLKASRDRRPNTTFMRAACCSPANTHDGAKLLQKALDRRHRIAINQFTRAKTPNEVRADCGGRRCSAARFRAPIGRC